MLRVVGCFYENIETHSGGEAWFVCLNLGGWASSLLLSLLLRISPPKGSGGGVDDAAITIGCLSLELIAPRFLCSLDFFPLRETGVASMMPRSPAGVGRQ